MINGFQNGGTLIRALSIGIRLCFLVTSECISGYLSTFIVHLEPNN